MIHFALGLYNSLLSVPEYRILIIGHGNSGKSVLMEQLKYMYHPNNTSTGAETPLGSSSTPKNGGSSSEAATVTAKDSSSAEDSLETLRSVLRNEMEKHASHGPSSSTANTAQDDQRVAAPVAAGVGTSSVNGAPLLARTSMPMPAPPSYLAAKHIRPTVGMNYAKINHYYSPLPSSTASTPPHTSSQRSLVMWDLGGERALRTLWTNYFPQCQAVIYVVDSGLYFEQENTKPPAKVAQNGAQSLTKPGDARGDTAEPSARTAAASLSLSGIPIDKEKARAVYAENRETLEGLLVHPQLQHVPFLVLSNKADLPAHMPLADMQDALDVAGLAVRASFYAENHARDNTVTAAAAEKPREQRHDAAEPPSKSDGESSIGTSGFGNVVMQLAEVSALEGAGLATAVDWLVAQLARSARSVEHD